MWTQSTCNKGGWWMIIALGTYGKGSCMLHCVYLIRWSPKEEHSMQTVLGKQLCNNIVPLMVDATTEYLSEQCNSILEAVIGPADSDKFANCIQSYVLSKCHKLLVDQSGADRYVPLHWSELCAIYRIKQNNLISSLLHQAHHMFKRPTLASILVFCSWVWWFSINNYIPLGILKWYQQIYGCKKTILGEICDGLCMSSHLAG